MTKIDMKKAMKELYNPPAAGITIIDVPAMNFVMIDGRGDPNTAPEYQDALEALYAISYALKFMVKKEQSVDYSVMPLEGLWWTEDMTRFSTSNRYNWKWTSMIMQPEYVSRAMFSRAVEEAARKKSLPSLSLARFQSFHEGLCAQTLYTGPFAGEGPTVEKLHSFIRENGYTFDGLTHKHHEIYLSDFRKTAPEKLKTIIRQPIARRQ